MSSAGNEVIDGTKKNGGETSELVSILKRLDAPSVAFLLQSARSLVEPDPQQPATLQDQELSASSQETFDQTFSQDFRIQ